ncbi:substrate-binding domain-containing protein [Paenibacillus sp. strain BS8-2]
MPQSSDISYTTDEIAKLLKISKLTVYDLIKKGEIPSYRVGKQMRVDAEDLEAYKQRNRTVPTHVQPVSLPAQQRVPRLNADLHEITPAKETQTVSSRSIVITGQDISLDILSRHLESEAPGQRMFRSHASSMDSLISMYKGEADLVSTHLLDGDTGEYNMPYIRRLLVGSPYLVVRLLSRQAGLFVAAGNPLGLTAWKDLARPGLRFANREQGAGARVLLDEQLRLHGIPHAGLLGYDHTLSNHLSVASKVASGEADVGVGTEKAASIVQGVDFIPLAVEHYDLVMLKRPENLPWIEAVLRILRSELFRRELRSMASYDLTRTGDIIAEA